MALKMVENSLFAILLRSPWWYSAAAGLLVITLAMAIARSSYLVLGVSLSLPFFGIAAYAAFKQSQRPSIKQIAEVAAQARKMTAAEVAEKIAANYTRERFESAAFSGAEAELELTRGYRKILVSSKRFKAANTGVEPLKKLIAAGERAEATGYLYVTLGEVSSNSLQFAKANNIEFIRAGDLAVYFSGKAKIQ